MFNLTISSDEDEVPQFGREERRVFKQKSKQAAQEIKKREVIKSDADESIGFADFNKSLDPPPSNLIDGEFVVRAEVPGSPIGEIMSSPQYIDEKND